MTKRKILLIILAGLLATTLGAPVSIGAAYYGNQVQYPVEDYPFASVIGDFNQDGKQDLAVSNGGSSSVSILLGNGDGTFKPAVHYSVKPTPSSSDRSPYYIVTGDYNRDGKLDLITANASSGDLSLLLGNGDGTFQVATSVAVGSYPWSIVNGDYNGDGNTDLAVTASDKVHILLGDGNGGFSAPVSYSTSQTPALMPMLMASGDFDEDGKMDLVTPDSTNSQVFVLLANKNGDGTFDRITSYATGSSPTAVAVGDINGDGHADLVVASNGDNTISVLLGNGNGTFRAGNTYSTNGKPWSIALVDFNQDSKLDVVVSNPQNSQIGLLQGNGDSTFQPVVTMQVGQYPRFISTGDFNGDGEPDLAVVNSSTHNVSILLNNDLHAPVWPNGSSLAVSNVTETALTLSWPAASDNQGVTGYQIIDGLNNTLLATVGSHVLTYQMNQLSAGTYHVYTIKALDAAGNVSSGLSQSVTTLKKSPPTLQADATSNDTYSPIEITFSDDPLWRGVITSIRDGSMELMPDKVKIDTGKLTISAGTLSEGTHTITVQADGYAEAMLSQQIGPSSLIGIQASMQSTSVKIGQQTHVTVTASYTSGQTADVSSDAVLVSQDPTIATVSGSAVTGVSAGSTVVTATYGGLQTNLSITVVVPPVIQPPVLQADATSNDTYSPIEITFSDDSLWRAAITSIRDGSTELMPDKVKIDTGKLTISAGTLSEGTHTITLQAVGYAEAMLSQQIRPSLLIGIQASMQSTSVKIGQQTHVTVTASYTSGQTADVSSDAVLVSQDPTIATVSGSAVTGVSAGSTVVTATYGGLQTNLTIAVEKPVIKQLTAEPSTIALQSGQSVATVITATYSDGILENVTPYVVWNVSPLTNVSVKDGLVTGRWAGSTVIQAVYGGITLDIPVRVTQPSSRNSSSNTNNEEPQPEPEAEPEPPTKPKPTLEPFNHMVNMDRLLTAIRNAVKHSCSASFTDLSTHWSASDVRTACILGIAEGYPDHLFKPDASVTRAEFSRLLVQAFALKEGDKHIEFRDTEGLWSTLDIRILSSNGVIEGYGDGMFKPNDPITRAEMVTMLLRILNVDALPSITKKTFRDIQSVSWAKSYIESAASAGIVQGLDDDRFAPERNASRAESVALILRTLKLDPSIRQLLDTIRQ